jgi:sugar phosphate isomerase/epimerase
MTCYSIGASAGYAFAHFGIEGTFEDYLRTVQTVADLGFSHYQIEILEHEHAAMYSPPRRRQWQEAAARAGIQYSDFCCYSCGPDLASLNAERNRRGLEIWQLSVEIARDMDISLVSMASDWAPELVGSYRSEYVHCPPDAVLWPKGFDWKNYWNAYVRRITECFELAKGAGLTMAYEPRANTVVGNLDAYLRLRDTINDDDFGCELDIMHIGFLGEDAATTIRRAGADLKLLQLCDSDGRTMHHKAIGAGQVNFEQVLEALEAIGYPGVLQLEIYGPTLEGRIDQAYENGRRRLEELMGRTAATEAA